MGWCTPPPPTTATAADGTHPTGMHSFFYSFNTHVNATHKNDKQYLSLDIGWMARLLIRRWRSRSALRAWSLANNLCTFMTTVFEGSTASWTASANLRFSDFLLSPGVCGECKEGLEGSVPGSTSSSTASMAPTNCLIFNDSMPSNILPRFCEAAVNMIPRLKFTHRLVQTLKYIYIFNFRTYTFISERRFANTNHLSIE